MRYKILCLIIATFYLSMFATAQFTISLPKIKKPDTSVLDKADSKNSKSQNRQIVIDDGFTFFDAEPLQEYNAAARRQVGIGG